MVHITRDAIRPEELVEKVRKDCYGAVVAFVGSVRDLSNTGERTLFLENDISAEGVARRELQRISDEIREKWQLEDVAICHRLGRLSVGEITLAVAVAAPHRKEAFEACQYVVDRFKEVVPAWETEVKQA